MNKQKSLASDKAVGRGVGGMVSSSDKDLLHISELVEAV